MDRRTFLTVTGASVLAGSVAAFPHQASAATTIDHARVLVAAQVEPMLGQTAGLADSTSTIAVQRALTAKGISTVADGWFGQGTLNNCTTRQKRLGYSGLDANGLPGRTSLQALGLGPAHVVNIGSRNDSYGGKRVNTRTRQMLAAADALVSWSIRLTQGSCNPGGVAASAGTHDGGGVVDVSISGLSSDQQWRTVKALRTVGFAAWLRTSAQGFTPHIHAVAIADADIAGSTARNQVADYWRGRNGLASHGYDNTPAAYRVPFIWRELYRSI